MRIGIVGAGRIGGNAAELFARAGHELMVSYSRDRDKLEALATRIGARPGTPREAVEHGDVVMVAVPWSQIDDALTEAGSVDGKVVIDTINQFGANGLESLPPGRTAAQVNAARMPGARYTKAFNTLTAGFQREASTRTGDHRAVMFLCGDDAFATQVVSGLIEDAGFVPVDVGSTARAALMEAPRRSGAVYGEEYREPEARAAVEAWQAGQPIPPAPSYS